ncbi:MAG TPA: UdgX family uracil-DNA binding protein [Vicinamibacteria bacterium]
MTRPIRIEPRFESWQAAARALLGEAVPPEAVEWLEGGPVEAPAAPPADGAQRVPRRFVDMARQVAGHPSPVRWALLYRVLWRIVHEDHGLLAREADADVSLLVQMERAVRSAAPFVPPAGSIPDLQQAARACTGCDLYRSATQTVFGQGPQASRLALVGEQPGDQEDRQGLPFVGPAGQVLDRALGEVGLHRGELYLTNVVKHFKFVHTGKRRLHQTPQEPEILACRPWLEAELQAVRPEVLVCLGATAARAVFGPAFRLMKQRGLFLPTRWTARTMATLHPSAVLRAPDTEGQERLYGLLKQDLATAVGALRINLA